MDHGTYQNIVVVIMAFSIIIVHKLSRLCTGIRGIRVMAHSFPIGHTGHYSLTTAETIHKPVVCNHTLGYSNRLFVLANEARTLLSSWLAS
jgi:hypothetical protein